MDKFPTLKVIASGISHSAYGRAVIFSKVVDVHAIIPWRIKVATDNVLPVGDWITAEQEGFVPNGRHKIPYLTKIAPSTREAVSFIREHHWLSALQGRIDTVLESKHAKHFTPLRGIGTLAALAVVIVAPNFTRHSNPLGMPAPDTASSGNKLKDVAIAAAHDVGRIMELVTPAKYTDDFKSLTIASATALKTGTSVDQVATTIVDSELRQADPLNKLTDAERAAARSNLGAACRPYLQFLQANVGPLSIPSPSKFDLNRASQSAWAMDRTEENVMGKVITNHGASIARPRSRIHYRHYHS